MREFVYGAWNAVALVAALVASAHAPLYAQRPSTMAGRSTVYAPSAVVASSQPLASAAGSDPRKGGMAVGC